MYEVLCLNEQHEEPDNEVDDFYWSGAYKATKYKAKQIWSEN